MSFSHKCGVYGFRKFAICSAVFVLLLSSACCAEWLCVSECTVNLFEGGRAVYRTYEQGKSAVDVIITEGAGTGSLYVPDEVRTAKGVMSSDAGYRVLDVAGHKAVLETRSFMPLALAVNAGDNIALTLESSSLSESEIVKFAEVILSSWKDTESDLSPAP